MDREAHTLLVETLMGLGMTEQDPASRWRRGRLAAAILVFTLCHPFGAAARADEYRLAADTKVQVAIVQWNPAKGEYQRWDALGGTFQVSQDGTLALPLIGALHVSDKTSIELAALISAQLREKAGLLSAPEVTVEIAEYPKIYVVGAVTTPGAYPFRPGLTVLQALAIAGGRYRPSADRQRPDTVTLRGELVTIRSDKLRLIGRIARLTAEIDGNPDIRFPPELTTDHNSQLVGEIVALEKALFAARENEIKRQLTTLADLRDMYTSEIQMLDVKSKESGKEIAQTEEEVAGLTKLVQQGIATVARWSELRRVLVQIRSAHSEDDIEALRARQNLSDATRKEFGIRDERQTEIATQLRDSQGDLNKLSLREQTIGQLLIDDTNGSLGAAREGRSELRFAVVRPSQSGSAEVPASESTSLLPGDVVKVELETALLSGEPTDAAVSAAPPDDPTAAVGQ